MLNQILEFLVAHQVVSTGLIIAIMDFIFAINKNLESNGLLHGLYLFVKGLKPPKAIE